MDVLQALAGFALVWRAAGLLTNLLNPKVGVFSIAIILTTLAARRSFADLRVTRWVDRVTGGVLPAFAGVLVAEELV